MYSTIAYKFISKHNFKAKISRKYSNLAFGHHKILNTEYNEQYKIPNQLLEHLRPKASPDHGKSFTYLIVIMTGVLGAIASKSIILNILKIPSPAKDVLALGQTEVDISNIPEGKSIIVKWRGKPIFIKHRTQQEISEAESVPLNELRDPQSDNERVIKKEWLVALGICTHLGCVPVADSGDFGGWYCPCQ